MRTSRKSLRKRGLLYYISGFRVGSWVATRAPIYRSLRALRAQNRKKSLKKSLFGVCKKVPEKGEKYSKLTFWVCFCFAILGPEGPETPVNGRSGRKSWVPKIRV